MYCSLIILNMIIDNEMDGYSKLDNVTCYTQIPGPHPNLRHASIACNNLGDQCNGIQQVDCKGRLMKITKSNMKTICKSKHSYIQNPDCNVVLYVKNEISFEGKAVKILLMIDMMA